MAKNFIPVPPLMVSDDDAHMFLFIIFLLEGVAIASLTDLAITTVALIVGVPSSLFARNASRRVGQLARHFMMRKKDICAFVADAELLLFDHFAQANILDMNADREVIFPVRWRSEFWLERSSWGGVMADGIDPERAIAYTGMESDAAIEDLRTRIFKDLCRLSVLHFGSDKPVSRGILALARFKIPPASNHQRLAARARATTLPAQSFGWVADTPKMIWIGSKVGVMVKYHT